MEQMTEGDLTAEVLRRLGATPDPRLREVMQSLVRHLHAFAREVRLTDDEWMAGIRFLTDAGHITDDVRQEFILLSDTLGLSSLVDLINHGADEPGPTDRRSSARSTSPALPSAPSTSRWSSTTTAASPQSSSGGC